MKKKLTIWVSSLLLLGLAISCGTSPAPKAEEAVKVDSKATLSDAAQVKDSKEYFGEGIILAGVGDRVGGPYTVNFYPAKVVTEPSEITKQEAKVVLRDKDGEEWTPYIARTRPAEKEDLEIGLIVFTGQYHWTKLEDKKDLEETKTWFIYRVKDLSNLYKDTVILTMYDGYWGEWKDTEVHYKNIRILEGELSLELREF